MRIPGSRARASDRTRTFGALAEHDLGWTEKLLRRCVTAGWVDLRRASARWRSSPTKAQAVMRGEREARLLLPPLASATRAASAGGAPGAAARDSDLDAAQTPLFEALRGFRLERARAEGVPPYVILHDRSLRDIARRRPANLDALRLCFGVGPAKAERWGEGLLAVVRKA